MGARNFDFALAIGGAAGQGIATPGSILARLFVRRGLHLYAYNAYQSIIRGGHIFLTIRISDQSVETHGDKLDLLVALNQDTMTRHLGLLGPGARAIYNSDTITPGEAGEGVQLCGLPIAELTKNNRNKLVQNTVALGAGMSLFGLDFQILEDALTLMFQRKGQAVVDENVSVARAGFNYTEEKFVPFPDALPQNPKPLAVWTGNEALAMGGAAAGVKFYCAYPMSPSTGVLHWMSQNARDLGIMVRQVEDEIAVANMAVGAAHTGCRDHVCHLGRGIRSHDRGYWLGRHDGNPGGVYQRSASRAFHRRAHKNRAGRPLADAGGQSGRFPAFHRRPPGRAGCLQLDSRDLQSLR